MKAKLMHSPVCVDTVSILCFDSLFRFEILIRLFQNSDIWQSPNDRVSYERAGTRAPSWHWPAGRWAQTDCP